MCATVTDVTWYSTLEDIPENLKKDPLHFKFYVLT